MAVYQTYIIYSNIVSHLNLLRSIRITEYSPYLKLSKKNQCEAIYLCFGIFFTKCLKITDAQITIF